MPFQNPRGNQDSKDIIIIDTKTSLQATATAKRTISLPDKNGDLLTIEDVFTPASIVFSTPGNHTYNIPTDATLIRFVATGGGGGGGSGARYALSNNKGGGAGGGGGNVVDLIYRVVDIPGNLLNLVIGAGGLGALPVTSDTTNGVSGGNGGGSSISASGRLLTFCGGGNGGGGGSNTAGGVGAITNTQGVTYLGSTGSSGSYTSQGSFGGNWSSMAASGGGGGAGISGSNVISSGLNGAGSSRAYIGVLMFGGIAGTAGSINGTSPTFDYLSAGLPGGGGGGGGFSSTSPSTGFGGNGGNGANPGGGGGGGGASNNGFTSGGGGNGGNGRILIIVW